MPVLRMRREVTETGSKGCLWEGGGSGGWGGEDGGGLAAAWSHGLTNTANTKQAGSRRPNQPLALLASV